jgi:hypothetical protein
VGKGGKRKKRQKCFLAHTFFTACKIVQLLLLLKTSYQKKNLDSKKICYFIEIIHIYIFWSKRLYFRLTSDSANHSAIWLAVGTNYKNFLCTNKRLLDSSPSNTRRRRQPLERVVFI